jgi:beta-lactamase class A
MVSLSPKSAALVFALAICVGAATVGCGSAAPASTTPASAAAVRLPSTPVGRQASWLVAAITHGPIPAAQIRQHFDRAFLAQVTPAKLSTALQGVTAIRVDSVTTSTPDALRFVVTANGTTRLDVSVAVDAAGQISGLLLQPASAPSAVPASWSGVMGQVRAAAPRAEFLVAAVTGGDCVPIKGFDAATPGPLGSAFKLYVLDALARAIAAGRVSWNQRLTVTSQVKSLPSGVLQDQPDGSTVTVRQAAADMISVSDNTAADMLITLLGRTAVESAARGTGMANPGLDVPFLTTRELFVLKLDDWPALAGRYLALSAVGRQAMLTATIDRVQLSTLEAAGWTAPRDVGSIEWFASPADICRVYASLATLARQPELRPLSAILSLNQGGLGLDPGQWRPDWFKGGSELGVLTLNYLATTRTGRTFVVSVLAENPAAPIPASATLALIGAATGAFTLAARTGTRS